MSVDPRNICPECDKPMSYGAKMHRACHKVKHAREKLTCSDCGCRISNPKADRCHPCASEVKRPSSFPSKVCGKCDTPKALSEFPKNASASDGRYTHCKDCVNSSSREKRRLAGVQAAPKRELVNSKLRCGRCKSWKRPESFSKAEGRAFGVSSTCKVCQKTWYDANKDTVKNGILRRMYGISLDDYNKMFVAQNGCCAICLRHQTEFKKALHVDHDHESDRIRGLLCRDCNRGIGMFADNQDRLRRASDYVSNSLGLQTVELEESV